MNRLWSMLSITILALFLGSCAGPVHHYRYKMTVVIETPDGLVSGSAVREITYQKLLKVTPESHGAAVEEVGQAVMVDMPDGSTLFALLEIGVSSTV